MWASAATWVKGPLRSWLGRWSKVAEARRRASWVGGWWR